MKRAGGLWPELASFENLLKASYQVLRGKRSRPDAGAFFFDLEGEILRLQRELLSGDYRPGPYTTFWIREPKARLISAAPLRDRVVHHALVNVIEPVFERRFIDHSYACRKGRGNHRALARFVRWARGSRFVLKLDVRKFFPSVDHEILRERIRRAIKDPDVLRLCDLIIAASNPQEPVAWHFPGDDLLTPLGRPHGIPIGNHTSQFFGNVYLDAVDHLVTDRLRVGRYLRYVDDLCAFGDDKSALRDLRAAIDQELASLRLRLNERKSRLRRVGEGIEFLGFVVTPHEIRLNQTATRRQRRRIARLRAGVEDGSIELAEVRASLAAWGAHAAHGSTRRMHADVLRAAVFYPARRWSADRRHL